jgi:hypothetical protein
LIESHRRQMMDGVVGLGPRGRLESRLERVDGCRGDVRVWIVDQPGDGRQHATIVNGREGVERASAHGSRRVARGTRNQSRDGTGADDCEACDGPFSFGIVSLERGQQASDRVSG